MDASISRDLKLPLFELKCGASYPSKIFSKNLTCPISNNFACLIFIFLPWNNNARLVAALGKMAGSNAEYVRGTV
jgi:hypothetical protein